MMVNFIAQTMFEGLDDRSVLASFESDAMIACGQKLLFNSKGDMETHSDADFDVIVRGKPRLGGLSGGLSASNTRSEQICEAYSKYGGELFDYIKGHFFLALYDKKNDYLIVATDKLATYPLYYTQTKNSQYIFSDSLSYLSKHPDVQTKIDKQAIYNYIYFHMIPSPGTVFQGISKIKAATFLKCRSGELMEKDYWSPRFRKDNLKNKTEIAQDLHQVLRQTIGDYLCEEKVGCFLSGGLDSSSVAGFMSKKRGAVPAFSIGFPIPEYNELPYARIAANRFSLDHKELILEPKDVIEVLPKIIQHMEQPFGNSSVIPTYCCAEFAKKNGVDVLFAGDGGDELFAGNTRYQKQLVFELYRFLPKSMRRILNSSSEDGLLGKSRLTQKVASYIKQSEIKLPLRLEQYNFLRRMGDSTIFTSDFLAEVDELYPEKLCDHEYVKPQDASPVDRMLYLDWKHTLTDNDLVKVRTMCELAGVQVRYPMLDDDLLSFSCDVPSFFKVNLTALRDVYKRAVKGFLPDEIIHKKKHGFGLPFGLWVKEDDELRAYAYGALEKLKKFEIFKDEFIDLAIEQHQSDHASYYGELVWILMVLGEWLDTKKVEC